MSLETAGTPGSQSLLTPAPTAPKGKVLLTGATGFIGSHVVGQAVAAGFEVAVLDNFSSGKPENVPAGVPALLRSGSGAVSLAPLLSYCRCTKPGWASIAEPIMKKAAGAFFSFRMDRNFNR